MLRRLAAVLACALVLCAAPAPVLQTSQLLTLVESPHPPAIFMVGPRLLYNGDHIRGAKFAGPASSPAGVELLLREAGRLPKDAKIVLYCGCCPMEKCPNIHPAFDALHAAGFTSVSILEIPVNLYTDWTAKGFPVEKGDIAK